jgi:hypothetical protein
MTRKEQPQQGELFPDAIGKNPKQEKAPVANFSQVCRLCGARGVHYFWGDHLLPVESWCHHCATWSRLIGGEWHRFMPVDKNTDTPGTSG